MPATASINLRISNEEKALISQAARSMGKTTTAFILENTLPVAEKLVMDRTRFLLDEKQWEDLSIALDTPPGDEQLEGLSKLFSSKAPWQKQ